MNPGPRADKPKTHRITPKPSPREPHPLWDAAVHHLRQKLDRIRQEIETYPAPIPACDLQFNTLLEEREQIAGELRRLIQTRETSADPEQLTRAVRELTELSTFFPQGWADSR